VSECSRPQYSGSDKHVHGSLSRGKFGTVYKCKEKSTGLCLAAKFIAVPNRKERKNVERELEMMNRLQHSKIIQLYDAYEFNKTVCVVLEL
jgi:serine/threonine protein kinase